MNQKIFKRTVLSLALALSMTACDGDDGADGLAGADGAPGADGESAPATIAARLIGRAVLNAEAPEGAAEIVAYQKSKGWVYALNSSGEQATVEVLDINTLDAEALVPDAAGVVTGINLESAITIDLTANTAGNANSIAIDEVNQLLAVAMASGTPGTPGLVAFYDISGAQPDFIASVSAGDLPDMVTFTPDGSKLLVANEGEPSGDYSVDPEGSISIIAIIDGRPAATATTLNFNAFDTQKAALQAEGVVFANPEGRTINGEAIVTSVSQDLEPEFITVAADGQTAWVTMQEANALAVVDLSSDTLQSVRGLGFKSWSAAELDPSDRDGGVRFASYPNLFGIFMPDTIAAYDWQGTPFLVTANEGDAREYFFDTTDEAACLAAGGIEFEEEDGCLAFIDEARVEDLSVSPALQPFVEESQLGRLKVNTFLGDAGEDGTYESLYAYGARSFSIFDQNGILVYDSGDRLEKVTAAVHGAAFNNNEDENAGDSRSDDKGPEPEALAIGTIGARTYAFVGLERMGGIAAFDISNPYQVSFMSYFFNRGLIEGEPAKGDLAPEGMKFVSASESPTDAPLLIVGNEVSGSVSIWELTAR